MKHLGYIKKELMKLYGKKQTEVIIQFANEYYLELTSLCQNASKGEWIHLENTILHVTSFYKALLQVDRENALNHTRKILIDLCETGGQVLDTFLKIPGMTSIFMMILPKMATKMFGQECGFDYEHLQITKSSIQMDMTVCPYLKYARLFDILELMPIFCESDFATYGKLSKISFIRNETLGTGGNKCDFKFIKKQGGSL